MAVCVNRDVLGDGNRFTDILQQIYSRTAGRGGDRLCQRLVVRLCVSGHHISGIRGCGFFHIYLVQILVRAVDKGGSCDRDRSNLLSFHLAGIIDAVSALLAAVFECVVRNCDCGGFGHRVAEHNSAAAAAQIKGVPRNRTLVDCTIGHRDRTGLVCSIKGAVCHRELFACNQHSPAAHVPEGAMIVCHIICMGIIERHIARFDLDVIESLHAFQSGEGRIGIGGVVPTVKHRKSVGTDGTVCYNQLPRFVDILAGLRPSSNADHRRRRTVDFVCGPGNRGDQFRVFQSQGSFGGAVMNNGAIGNCSAGHPLNNAVLDGKICSRFRGF